MAKDFNQAIILGNLTRDPELRYTPNGQAVTSFAVATNRVWSDTEGERKESVEYHDVVAWGKIAEIINQYLKKGSRVMVVGRLQTRSWEAQDGSKRYKTEIVATDVNFIDRLKEGAAEEVETALGNEGETSPQKDEGETSPQKENDNSKKREEEEINIEDIPF